MPLSMRFKAHEGLLTSAFGEAVKQRYLVFARAVDAYINRLYADWEQVRRHGTGVGLLVGCKMNQRPANYCTY